MVQPQNQNSMSVAGAIATGVGALGSALIGTTASSNLNRRNRQWQHDEAELARQRAAEEWQREFEAANQYNTPTAVKQRLADAGINPNVAFENTQTSAMSNATPQKTPTYAGAPATFPLQGLAATGGFESAMRSVSALVDAVKTARLTPALKSQIEADIQSKIARAEADESQRDLNQFELELKETYGKRIMSKSLQKLTYETLSAFQDIMLKAKQGQEIDANIFLKKAQELREYAQANLSEMQAAEVDKIISRYDEIVDNQIAVNRSTVTRNMAQAALFNEEGNDLRATRYGRVWLLGAQRALLESIKDLNYQNFHMINDTWQDRVDLIAEQLEQAKVINEEVRQRIDLLIKEKNWKDLEKLLQSLESVSRILENSSSANRNNASTFKIGKDALGVDDLLRIGGY